jgi:hypothetical protein
MTIGLAIPGYMVLVCLRGLIQMFEVTRKLGEKRGRNLKGSSASDELVAKFGFVRSVVYLDKWLLQLKCHTYHKGMRTCS